MVDINDFKVIESLPDSKELVKQKFQDQESTSVTNITILNRESTSKGSPLKQSFNLNFDRIQQAVLKITLLSDTAQVLGFIPQEFKLTEFFLNGKRFTTSDARSSVNVVEKSNDTSLNKVLNLQGDNQVSISFDAPFGTGVLQPNTAEITAILTIHGVKGFFNPSELLNTTQTVKDVNNFITNNTPLAVGVLVLIIAALIAVAVIVTKGSKGVSKGADITGDIRGIIREVKS